MSDNLLVASRPAPRRTRPPLSMRSFWNDVEIRAWIYQLLVIVTVIGIGAFLISNAQDALRKQGISTGFDFLLSTAEFDIGEKSIPFHTTDTFLRAYGVALINTLKVSAVSIILATLIGVLVGVGRLSPHFLVRRLSSIYVEVFRNTPQLVQLIFWYTVITNLPGPRNAISIVDVAFLSNRGFSFPWPSDTAALACVAGALLAGLGMGLFAARILEARRRRTGRTQPIWIWSLILVLGPPAAVWLSSDSSILLTVPQRRGFNFQGGLTISPEFLALLLGLSLYIGAFIAEIVRSGIQSVGRGQIEAARSIGLGTFDTYRKVIFPQALRVIVPPATGQYVSLVKNSSLGVAIGYPEMFSVNNTIITLSGHTVEAIAIMMSIYLAISFVIAAMMNVYNRFVQIKER